MTTNSESNAQGLSDFQRLAGMLEYLEAIYWPTNHAEAHPVHNYLVYEDLPEAAKSPQESDVINAILEMVREIGESVTVRIAKVGMDPRPLRHLLRCMDSDPTHLHEAFSKETFADLRDLLCSADDFEQAGPTTRKTAQADHVEPLMNLPHGLRGYITQSKALYDFGISASHLSRLANENPPRVRTERPPVDLEIRDDSGKRIRKLYHRGDIAKATRS